MDLPAICEGILPGGAMVLFGLGIASHLIYFIHGELNKQAGETTTFFLAVWSALIGFFVLLCQSPNHGFFIATTLVLCYQLGFGISITTYRLFFHRVRSFPGPWSAALTKWEADYTAKTTWRYHAHLRLLHLKYGDIVRTGPQDEVVGTWCASEDSLRLFVRAGDSCILDTPPEAKNISRVVGLFEEGKMVSETWSKIRMRF